MEQEPDSGFWTHSEGMTVISFDIQPDGSMIRRVCRMGADGSPEPIDGEPETRVPGTEESVMLARLAHWRTGHVYYHY